MDIQSDTYWIWTEKGQTAFEKEGIYHRAGDTVTMVRDGCLVKRQDVPESWVQEGLVEEAPYEQPRLF